jgi:FkbM family methyltransferase
MGLIPMSEIENRQQFLEFMRHSASRGRSLQAFARTTLAVDSTLVLFGAGGFSGYLIPRLRNLGFQIKALVDSNSAKWGRTIAGIQIIGPEEYRSIRGPLDQAVTSVCGHTSDFSTLSAVARSAGFQNVWPAPIFFWLFPEAFLPFLGWEAPSYLLSHQESLADVFEYLVGETSRSHFIREVALRMSMDVSEAHAPDIQNQYFIPEIKLLGASEIFFDGGAYDGDTMQSYLRRCPEGFQRWIAVEPDLMLQQKILNLVQSLRLDATQFQIVGAALGDHVGRTHFTADASMTATLSDTAILEVEMVTIDAICADEISFLKLDIEGGEALVLEGARKTLARSEDRKSVV